MPSFLQARFYCLLLISSWITLNHGQFIYVYFLSKDCLWLTKNYLDLLLALKRAEYCLQKIAKTSSVIYLHVQL